VRGVVPVLPRVFRHLGVTVVTTMFYIVFYVAIEKMRIRETLHSAHHMTPWNSLHVAELNRPMVLTDIP
jgi:hypothetical protein